MIQVNTELMHTLVEAKQQDLRGSHHPHVPNSHRGVIRKAIGSFLIRTGERVGGTPRIPSPARDKLAHS